MKRRGSKQKKASRPDYKKIPTEYLAERVFVTTPRSFSFSHRSPCSVRHPYLQLVCECLDSMTNRNRVSAFLEAFIDAKNEADKWARAGTVFDSKMHSPELDGARQKILVSTEAMISIEALWSILGGTNDGYIYEEAYRHFHHCLYSMVLRVDDVSIQTAAMSAVNEDFAFDTRGEVGVSFGSFANSVLEVADNWTASRELSGYINFLQQLVDIMTPRRISTEQPKKSYTLSNSVFFSGGLLAKRNDGGHAEYVKLRNM